MARTPRYLFGRVASGALAAVLGGGGGGGGVGSPFPAHTVAVEGPITIPEYSGDGSDSPDAHGWTLPPQIEVAEFTIEETSIAVLGGGGIAHYIDPENLGRIVNLATYLRLADDTNYQPIGGGAMPAWQPDRIEGARDPDDYYWFDPTRRGSDPFPTVMLPPGDYVLELRAGCTPGAHPVTGRDLSVWAAILATV